MATTEVPDSPLPGRGEHLAALGRAHADAAAGRPRVVIVNGLPGMGKTRLLNTFAESLPTGSVTRIVCDPFEAEIAYGAAGLLLADSLVASPAPTAVAQRLLAWLGERQDGQNPPAVVLLDDVHWMDAQTVGALRFALRRLRADRILVVLAQRPAAGDRWASLIADTSLSVTLTLTPLLASDVADVAASQFGRALTAATADRLARETAGLPLLIAASLSELATDGEMAVSAADAGRRLLRSLDRDSARLVEALAVLAVPSTLVTLGAVALVADPSLALTSALTTQAIRVGDDGLIDFSHAIYRSAVYDSMVLTSRRELHQRAASWSRPDRALQHRVTAADRPDSELVADLVAAAGGHERSNRHAVAASLLIQARTLAAEPDLRHRLLLTALWYRLEAHDLTAALSMATEVEALPQSAFRHFVIGLLRRETGQVDEADQLLSRSIEAAVADGDPQLAVRASMILGSMHAGLNHGAETLTCAQRAIDLDAGDEAVVLNSLGLWLTGRLEDALAEIDDSRLIARDPSDRANQVAVRGLIRHYAGDVEGAAAELDAAVALLPSWRPSGMLDRVFIQRCLVRFTLGDWDGSSVDGATARTLADSGDQPWTAASAYAVSMNVPVGRGQFDLAVDYLAQGQRSYQSLPSPQAGGLLASAAATLAAAQGDWGGVLRVLAPMRKEPIFRRMVASHSYRWLLVPAIEANIRLGRLQDAEDDLTLYQSLLSTVGGGGSGPRRVSWLQGLLAEANGNGAGAQACYAAELTAPDLLASPHTHASTLYDSGRLERALGSRREAIDRLRQARAIALSLRAAPLVERCDNELAATGLPQTTPGPLALTPREQDVAALVARGLTNGEVAAELFLTVKTVEYHLRNIYAKLGISGRKGLRQKFPAHS